MMMLFFPASIGRKGVFATRRRSRSHLRDLLFISSCARATALASVSSLVCSCISAGGRAVHLVFGACWCLDAEVGASANALLAHNPFRDLAHLCTPATVALHWDYPMAPPQFNECYHFPHLQ